MRRFRKRWADACERFLASDPGLIRMRSALGTVASAGLALGVLATLGASVPVLVTGALAAMVSTVAVTEPRPREQVWTLAAGVPVALTVVAAGTALAAHRVAADGVFVVLIFGALYLRRLGPRATALGVFAFQLFFVTQFAGTKTEHLPQLFLAVVVAFGCSALIRFTVLRSSPYRTLRRLERAFRLRLMLLLGALADVADGGARASRAKRHVRDLRRHMDRLHASAMTTQSLLGTGTLDVRTVRATQSRVLDAEAAAGRLTVLVLRALWPGADIDILTSHRTKGSPLEPDLALRAGPVLSMLASELRRLRETADPRPSGTWGIARTRLATSSSSRGTSSRTTRQGLDDEEVSRAPSAVQDVFRSVEELSLTLLRRDPADGLRVPAARPREEAAAESHTAKDPAPNGRAPRVLPTTRTALQVTAGSALAVVGGELLSPERWYWAVFTCWVVFISTASFGEVLLRGGRRLAGTVAGVFAGLAVAALVGDSPWLALALVGVSVFGMYYTLAVSYTLMSFFVTTMIGMLYALLHSLTPEVLAIRIEQTALGVACGAVAARLVLPVHTRNRTDRLLREALEALREALARSLAPPTGGGGGDAFGPARALDAALDSLRQSVQPLITPASPLRSRRGTALHVLGLLESAAFHTRGLAATAELEPPHLGPDPYLMRTACRIDHQLGCLIDLLAVRDTHDAVSGRRPAPPCRLGLGEGRGDHGVAGSRRRVLRHLQRVDHSVQHLARALRPHSAA